MVKEIYFVRHGETHGNKLRRHQHYDESLSDVGQEQAQAVGSYLARFKPDTIYTSSFTRARQTAEAISEAVGQPYVIVQAVHEVLRPAFLYGKSHYSPATALYLWQLFTHRGDYDWDNDEAENMFNIRNRVYDTKDLLMEEPAERIVVVSHALFIYMFLELVCQERLMSFWQFIKLMIFVKKIPNTTVIKVRFNPDYVVGTCPWILESVTEPEDFK